MTGNNFDAEEAHRLGIVNQIHSPEDLESKTMEMAQNIASKSMHTLRIAKSTIRAALDNGFTKVVEIEAEVFADLFNSEDQNFGVQAFIDRTNPEWKHR